MVSQAEKLAPRREAARGVVRRSGSQTQEWKAAAIFLLPTTQAMRLGANAFAGRTLYGGLWLSFLIIAAWGVAAYGLLWWRLSRREDY